MLGILAHRSGRLMMMLLFLTWSGSLGLWAAQQDSVRHEETGCGDTKAGCCLCAQFERNRVPAAEPVKMVLKVRNTSERAVFFSTRGRVELNYKIKVVGPDGHTVSFTAYGQDMIEPRFPKVMMGGERIENLRPKEERTDSIILNKFYDMTLPGPYRVVVQCKVYKDETWDESNALSLESREVTVDVLGDPTGGGAAEIKDYQQVYLIAKLIGDVEVELKKPKEQRDEGHVRYACSVIEKVTGWGFRPDLDLWRAFLVAKVLSLVDEEQAKPQRERNQAKIDWYWNTAKEATGKDFGGDLPTAKRYLMEQAVALMERELAKPGTERSDAAVKWCWQLLQKLTGKTFEADVKVWKKVLQELEAEKKEPTTSAKPAN